MTRSIAGSAAAFVLLGLTLPGLAGCDQPPAPRVEEVRPVRVATVRFEPSADSARYAAVVRPRVEADLGFRVGGKVAARLVETGARVEPGTPLARLDPTDLALQVKAAEAQLAAVRADAAATQADAERYARLRQGEWTTQQEFDRRRAAAERAAARVREIEAQLRVLRNGAEYTTLVADARGIVTATLVEPGQVVAPGQTAFRVAREGALEAVADIPEREAGRFHERQLMIEAWSLPGLILAGSLRELAPSADPATRTYRARITLVDPPPGLQIGMTATVIATLERIGPVARLPLAAITQRGTDPAVWVVNGRGDAVELRPVTLAAYSGDLALVSAGLGEGERVVTAGVHKLDPGQKIRVWQEAAR